MLKSATRITAFIGKEMRELIRRPGALLSLLFGPLIIMAVFGVGYTGTRRPMDTVLVIPPETELTRDVAYYNEIARGRVNVVEVSDDAEAARARLERQEIGLVVIAPSDAVTRLLAGEQSVVRAEWNQVDPVADNLARFIVNTLVAEINREITEQAATRGIAYIERETGQEAPVEIPPEVLAAPTRAEIVNVAPSEPGVLRYFGPAVFALVLQHLAVTVTALSIVRERLSGAVELFRVAPVSALEVLLGKYVAFGILCVLIGFLVAALMLQLLGLPLLGGFRPFVLVVGLLTFASLGLGLLISIIADSERQAVQLAMLVLLASVFFSGFVMPVEEFIPEVRWFAYSIPVTHGIRLLQDTMLRGETVALWQLWTLGGIGLALFVLTGLLLGRLLARG